MKIRAAVLRDSRKKHPFSETMPLQIEDVDLDPPGPDEVLMKIKAVGLCHSDLVAINGERGKPMPMVIGHEAAGIIVGLGSNVVDIDIGDHVVPSYVASCGRCDMCREGRPALCIPAFKSNAAGTMLDGTTRLHQGGNRIFHHSGIAAFAEYAVISINAIVKIDKELPFEQAALFGCGVCTGVGAVVNTAKIRPGQTAAIVGLGGVGLSAMLAAIASGADRVIAVDVNEDKLKLALELGAYKAFNARDADCVEKILQATGGGVHIAVETAGAPQALETAYKITARGGTTVAAGMPGPDATITLSHLSLSGEERTLKGSYMGSCVPSRDIPRFIGLFQNGKLPIDKLTSHQIKFEELNEAFDRMVEGSALRQVMVL